ncbi:MAG: DUF4350 domain-containing protein [Microcella sp.]
MSATGTGPADAGLVEPRDDLNAELSTMVMTPTVRRVVRRSLFWAGSIGGALTLGVIILGIGGSTGEPRPYAADETAPVGSRAVVEVLRDAGVEVTVVDRLGDALEAALLPGTTLLVADTRAILDAEQWPRVLNAAEHLVLVEPSQPALDALRIDALTARPLGADESGLAPTGLVATEGIELEAGCSLPAARRAQSILASGTGYSTLEGAACFDAGQDGAGLIRLTVEGDDVTVLGAATVLQNGSITRAGNAALALGLLGEHEHLVWYQPSPADIDALTPAELAPDWLNPLAWLAVLVGLAAAVWRGRRFGPVVIENLPVTVKTTETMEGHARLYAREGSRLRALDALRVGTLRRLAEGLALGRGAGVDDIITAVAGITGRDRASLRALLVDTLPTSDRELVVLSDQLAALERLVAQRVGLDDAGLDRAGLDLSRGPGSASPTTDA